MHLHISERCPATDVDIHSMSVTFPELPVSFNCLELVSIKVFEQKREVYQYFGLYYRFS